MARGRAGTQMSNLPAEHARSPEGGALCGATRKWGALTVQKPEDTNCKKCLALLDQGTDCAWCGGECERPHFNRRGEVFCSPNHRSSSNRALRRLVESQKATRADPPGPSPRPSP